MMKGETVGTLRITRIRMPSTVPMEEVVVVEDNGLPILPSETFPRQIRLIKMKKHYGQAILTYLTKEINENRIKIKIILLGSKLSC